MDKLRSYNLSLSKIISKLCEDGEIPPLCHIFTSKNRFYEPIFKLLEKGDFSYDVDRLNILFHYLRFFTVAVIRVVNSVLFRRKMTRLILSKYHGKEVFLLKSFRIKNNHFKKEEDPFFGPVVDLLRKEKIEPLFYLENLSGGIVRTNDDEDPFLEVMDFVGWRDLFWTATTSLRYFVKSYEKLAIDDPLYIKHKEVLKKIFKWEYLKPNSLNNLLQYRASRYLAKYIQIKRYIYPYENNCWERVILAALKKEHQVLTIGYQHNVIPPSSLNMFPLENELSIIPQPDWLLTTGPYTKDLLIKHSSFDGEKIKSSCALRYQYLHNADKLVRNMDKVVLVALEGVGQILDIIERVYCLMANNPDINFIFRCHPVLHYEAVSKRLSFDIQSISNFEVSKGKSVYEDLARSSVVLYWGSTLGLEAIKMGRPVVNASLGDISFDPLFELKSFKTTWNIEEDNLGLILKRVFNLDRPSFVKEQQDASDFIDAYFSPVCEANLKPFLEKL